MNPRQIAHNTIFINNAITGKVNIPFDLDININIEF